MAAAPAHIAHPPYSLHKLDDPPSGLSGVIVLHSLRLGPAAGGCRLWHYADETAAITDAIRLAEGMSYKNAMAGLPLGGGKAVLRRPAGAFDRALLFDAFGRAVQQLGGSYVTAEDVGTSVADMTHVARRTHHVAGLAQAGCHPGGDPSPWTARGVFAAMQAAAEQRFGRGLPGMTVAVQGLGHVGFALCALLHEAGARLIVADVRDACTARASEQFSARVVAPGAIVAVRADVLAPCALGAVLHGRTISQLRVGLVCGGANNQLASDVDGEQLFRRGILYAPDYVANAGGIINVAAEYLRWPIGEVAARVAAIGPRMTTLLREAEASGEPPHRVADRIARRIIADGPAACPKSMPRASFAEAGV